MKKVIIGFMCDGWEVQIDDKKFSWNHNDEDMGTEAIKKLLEHLEFDVEIEEWY